MGKCLLLPGYRDVEKFGHCRQNFRCDKRLDLAHKEGLYCTAPEGHQVFFRYLKLVFNEEADNQNCNGDEHDSSPLVTSRS